MEFEPENQILQNVPSISVVSQEQDEVTSDSRKDYGKTPSHCSDSVSDKNAIQSNQAVTNGVTTVETKIETSQIVSELTPSIMPESILAEVNEPTTKAINLNSNLLSIDLPVTEAQRQSSPFITSKGSDERLDLITKEEMKIQDLSKVVNHSDNITQGIYMAQAESRNEERQESCRQDACKTQIPFSETKNGFDAAMPEAMTSLKDNPVQEEVLDLSLPKKKVRDNREKWKWVLDSEYEGSLLMEVDEIENETQHVEVEQDEDDEECWFCLCNDDHTNSLNLENWEQHSVPHVAIESPCTSFLSLNSKDTLLIDDQGIPYTLDPDGKKVPQIDPCEMPEVASEEISLGFEPFVDEESAGSQGADPAQDSTSDFSIETSQDTLILENKSPQDHSDEAVSAALPDISSLPSLPIQIMASNTGTNTPILLLPQSQLQTFSSSATNSNPGVMALTLPLALAQNTQSSPVFLLLSSPQVSEIPSSTLSGQLSQISSTSCIALPSLGLKTDPVSCTATTTPNTITTTDVSGQKNKPCKSSSVPTSPTASTSTSPMIPIGQTKQIKSEACSDTPTSFQEALLRLAVSAVQKAENQPKSAEALSVVTTLTDTTQSGSSSATNTQEDNGKMEEVSSPISELDQTDSPSLSTTSPVCPSSPIFPTNHPKNQDSQNQSLGPRRILYCQYCPRVFYYLSDLERHSITHSQSKPHVCQLCGKAFKRSSHLERHKHIHTGQRNFVCQLCPRRFREAAELTRHQRVHTGEKPFQCLLCHMRFAERNTLRRHTKRKHQGQQQEAMSIKVKPQTEGVSLLNIQGQQEENAEWYSSTMTEMDSDNDTGGE